MGFHDVAVFDLTRALGTPRVLVAPRGWTCKRQVPGSHQEVLSSSGLALCVQVTGRGYPGGPAVMVGEVLSDQVDEGYLAG
jgi:hypothetical protein